MAKSGKGLVRLNTFGAGQNVNLRIADIHQKLCANMRDEFLDLLEIAAYVFAADQACSRGGEGVRDYGHGWHRNLRFQIPVRVPGLWQAEPLLSELTNTLSFLSDDNYTLEFSEYPAPARPSGPTYFEFASAIAMGAEPVSVIPFSGGLDSLAGAVEEAVGNAHSVALVSHRSVSKIDSRQQSLVREIRSLTKAAVHHVPVWVNKDATESHDFTQRSRSFLFACLAAVVARLFGLDGIRFYENGIVSVNLPISAQVIGGRATRTTHPTVLNGFARIFSHVFGRTFTVVNPFMWKTKSEVVSLLAQHKAEHLISQTVSCTHTWHTTKVVTHCGCCSQCIDRRFAVLGAELDAKDPEEIYEVPLWTGARKDGVDRTMAESYVRAAVEIKNMPTDSEFFIRYPVVNSLTREFPVSAEETAQRILDLHQRHAAKVCSLTAAAIQKHAQDMLRGTIPPSSLLRIVAGGTRQSTDWRQFVKQVGNLLEKGLNTTFQSSVPDKEAQVNDATQAILDSYDATIVREFPMFKWGVVGTKPDFATSDNSIFIESKLLRDRSKIVGVSDSLIADREKYLTKAKHILFVVYQRGRIIMDEDDFCSGIERGEEAAVRLIIGRSSEQINQL
jgi:hypothetical protein